MPLGRPQVPFWMPGEEEATWIEIQDFAYQKRVLFLFDEIQHENTANLLALLTYLDLADDDYETGRVIHLFIHSQGGLANAGISLYETMQRLYDPVHTFCAGMAGSIASLVLSGGERGSRLGAPNSRIWIHEPAMESPEKAEEPARPSRKKRDEPAIPRPNQLGSPFPFPKRDTEPARPSPQKESGRARRIPYTEPTSPIWKKNHQPARTIWRTNHQPTSPIPQREAKTRRKKDFFLERQRGGLGGVLEAEEMFRWRESMVQIYAQTTGQPESVISKDMGRDFLMTAEEARDYGILDRIVLPPE